MAASGSPATGDVEAEWSAPYAVDLRTVLEPFGRGRNDPVTQFSPDGVIWRTCRTPEGPATARLAVAGDAVRSAAWGPGSAWLVSSLPALLGESDDPAGFPAASLPSVLESAWTRHGARWRTPRSRRVVESLVIAVLEQKVTGIQARRAWVSLLSELGDVAPGPAPSGMRVLPSADTIRRVPSWQWHRWGVAPSQSATLMRVMQVAPRVEECADLPLAEARRRLGAIPGIGPWTVAEVSQRALGDADAVSFGDYHLAKHLVYAFTGDRDGTDEQMADLLAPFAGHRYRVQRILELSGVARPAHGPRITIADHRRI
jgi:3-methyladenine DNA glycosylase/8-oxoguanine DNA glycosylase